MISILHNFQFSQDDYALDSQAFDSIGFIDQGEAHNTVCCGNRMGLGNFGKILPIRNSYHNHFIYEVVKISESQS